MAIKDVEGIYYHDGDLVKVIFGLTYLSCESPDLCRYLKTRLDTAKSRPSR